MTREGSEVAAGERNNLKENADVYVVSAGDHASDSHRVSLTSATGATATASATPIPEEIPQLPVINEMVSELR